MCIRDSFPKDRLFDWVHVGHFRPDQNLLMHSVMYRTEVLRQCGMVLPKHTFYVDNIFVYQQMCIRDRGNIIKGILYGNRIEDSGYYPVERSYFSCAVCQGALTEILL